MSLPCSSDVSGLREQLPQQAGNSAATGEGQLAALKAAALAATPGARKFEPHPYGYGYSVLWVPETRAEILVTGGTNDGDNPITWMGEELTDGDRQFLEATDPALVLDLIARLEAAEAALADLTYDDGPMRDTFCPDAARYDRGECGWPECGCPDIAEAKP